MNNIYLKAQIPKSIENAKSFLNNYKSVIQNFQTQKKEYITQFLDILQVYVTDPNADCNRKFFSLFFITKASESKNPELVNQLAGRTQILSRLEIESKFDKDKGSDERGSLFFSKTPNKTENTMEKNYIRLVIESIQFWNKEFGSDDKKSPNFKFRDLYKKLVAEKVKITEKQLVIGRPLKTYYNQRNQQLNRQHNNLKHKASKNQLQVRRPFSKQKKLLRN